MIYGENKARQMARSILPSTRRKAARENLRAIKQSHRALVRRELRRLDEENEPRDCFDPRGYPTGKIAYEVRERQNADKLGHFEKWAVEISKGIPEADGRRKWVRALLPAGLIGDHAMTHLDNYDAFETNTWRYSYRWKYGPDLTPEEQAKAVREAREAVHARRVRLLREVVASGWGHRLLNAGIPHSTVVWQVWTKDVPTEVPDGVHGKTKVVLRDRHVAVIKGPTVPRKLGGLGDIEAFLGDLEKASRRAVIDTGERLVVRDVRACRHWYRPVPTPAGVPTYVTEYIVSTRPNPEYHPEWLKSVDSFLDRWEEAQGDERKLRLG